MVTSQMIRELLANGVHFGHPTNKWNPKMEKFIFGEKSGIYIIDLEKTEQHLKKACEFVKELAKDNKAVLFAGTKRQAKNIVKQEAERCGMFYVDERWLGGCLTNFQTIRKSVDKLNEIQKMKEGDIYDSLAKKEQARIDREENKLLRNLGGIRNMEKLPACVVIVDTVGEGIAVRESVKKDIPIVGILDTNSDPDDIEYPIPANDDAIRSIRYILSSLADSIIEGSGGVVEKKQEEDPEGEEVASPGERTESKEGSAEHVTGVGSTKEENADKAEKNAQDREASESEKEGHAEEDAAPEEEALVEERKEKAAAEEETSREEEVPEEEKTQEKPDEGEKDAVKKGKPVSAGTDALEGDIKLDD